MSLGVVYVTGATGFIGSHLISVTKDRYDVRPVSRTALEEADSAQFENGSSFIHLGGRVHVLRETATDPLLEFRKANVANTVKCAQTAIRCKVNKFIFISSLSVFGRFSGGTVMEGTEPRPDDPYGMSKHEAEKRLKELFIGQTDSQCIILRLPMVYGPGNKGNMIPLLKMASKGIPLPLAGVTGKRSLLYVGNLVSALQAVLEDTGAPRPPLQEYFLSDGVDLTSGELFTTLSRAYTGEKGVFYFPKIILEGGALLGDLIEKITSVGFPLNSATLSRLFNEYRFSSSQFQKDYGWRPPFTPEEGLSETVGWHRNLPKENR